MNMYELARATSSIKKISNPRTSQSTKVLATLTLIALGMKMTEKPRTKNKKWGYKGH